MKMLPEYITDQFNWVKEDRTFYGASQTLWDTSSYYKFPFPNGRKQFKMTNMETGGFRVFTFVREFWNTEGILEYVFSSEDGLLCNILIEPERPEDIWYMHWMELHPERGLREELNDESFHFQYPSQQSTENRPWGEFEVLLDHNKCKVKKITIRPGQAPSYQYHFKRSEVWTIIKGEGELKLNDSIIKVSSGSTYHIEKEAKHQIKNTGNEDLIFIEIQLGEYFGEDDIVRLEDNYGRV